MRSIKILILLLPLIGCCTNDNDVIAVMHGNYGMTIQRLEDDFAVCYATWNALSCLRRE